MEVLVEERKKVSIVKRGDIIHWRGKGLGREYWGIFIEDENGTAWIQSLDGFYHVYRNARYSAEYMNKIIAGEVDSLFIFTSYPSDKYRIKLELC